MFFTIFFYSKAFSQRYWQQFKGLHTPEKLWILRHPHLAKKTFYITKRASQLATEAINDPQLDGDHNGGQVDALRHTLWMAMLTQKINKKAAKKLGIAHEKGNEIDFKKKLLEEGKLPDSVSCEMDLKNNLIGIQIGTMNKNAEIPELFNIVKKAVLNGDCFIIKKDKNGNFLDQNNNIIPPEIWKGKWEPPKIIVPSNNKN